MRSKGRARAIVFKKWKVIKRKAEKRELRSKRRNEDKKDRLEDPMKAKSLKYEEIMRKAGNTVPRED